MLCSSEIYNIFFGVTAGNRSNYQFWHNTNKHTQYFQRLIIFHAIVYKNYQVNIFSLVCMYNDILAQICSIQFVSLDILMHLGTT